MIAWIVDDEKQSAEITEVLLLQVMPDIGSIQLFNDPVQALKNLEKEKPDLIFLDIEMPGVNGLEFLAEIQGDMPSVIFTTAYDQFAIKAFRLGAIDYLVKPIEEDELKAAVDRVMNRQDIDKRNELKDLINEIRNSTRPDKLPVSDLNGIQWIEYDEIIRCESESNYTSIITRKKKLVATRTLKQIEASLPSPQFFRVHHSHLVNTVHITSYHKGTGGTLVLSNGEHVPVSRQNKVELMKIMGVK